MSPKPRWVTDWLALRVAMQFLTCLPVPVNAEITPRVWGRSLIWYPAVGLILGGLLWLFTAALPDPFPAFLTATLIVAVWTALTGALHLDGWADCVDAWVGGLGERERTLSIMKDPRSGPMGVAALVLLLVLKVAALTALLDVSTLSYWWLAPLLARMLLIPTFLMVPYVRTQGLGSSMAEQLPRSAALLMVAAGLMLVWYWLPTALFGYWLVVVSALFVVWRHVVLKRLQGFTGDCAGALVELAELILLLTTAVVLYS